MDSKISEVLRVTPERPREITIPEGCVAGTFIEESKNRFRCVVNVNGAEENCYISSSCRLENFIDLVGRTVILKTTTGAKSAAKYVVWGVKYKRSYILLNSALANQAVETSFYTRKLSFIGKRKTYRKEFTAENYKTDFFIPESNTIIEVKSVISTAEIAPFGTIQSKRLIRQLEDMDVLLQNGYRACLIIVSMNPYVKGIVIPTIGDHVNILKRCVDNGLLVRAYTCRIAKDGNVSLDRAIPIKWN